MKENFNLDLFINNFRVIMNGYFNVYEADCHFDSVSMYFWKYISEYESKKEFDKSYKNLSKRQEKFIDNILQEEYGCQDEDGYCDMDEFVDYCESVIEELKDKKPFKTDYYTEYIERNDNINCIQNLANEIVKALCVRYFRFKTWLQSREDLNRLLGKIDSISNDWNLKFDIKEEDKKNRSITDKYYEKLNEILDKHVEDVFNMKDDIEIDGGSEEIVQFLPSKYYQEIKTIKREIDEETKRIIDDLNNRFVFVDLTKNKVIERV